VKFLNEYASDVHKLDEWQTLLASEVSPEDWVDSGSSSESEGSEEDDDDEDDDDDDDEDDDDEEEEKESPMDTN
jgi:hypothetical protein